MLNDLAHWVVNTCDPVQVPTDQTDIPISEDTTSHTGMPAGPVPATGAEPSHTRARTHPLRVAFANTAARCGGSRVHLNFTRFHLDSGEILAKPPKYLLMHARGRTRG